MTRESMFHGSIFLEAPKTRHIAFKQFYKLKSILGDHLILQRCIGVMFTAIPFDSESAHL